jgi:hypothetical protein
LVYKQKKPVFSRRTTENLYFPNDSRLDERPGQLWTPGAGDKLEELVHQGEQSLELLILISFLLLLSFTSPRRIKRNANAAIHFHFWCLFATIFGRACRLQMHKNFCNNPLMLW